jgi:ATP-dependent exoDNAse (exonuclease V) beta subunit
VRLPSLRDEGLKIADLLAAAHQEGHAWGDMAILCRRHSVMFECASVLRRAGCRIRCESAPATSRRWRTASR